MSRLYLYNYCSSSDPLTPLFSKTFGRFFLDDCTEVMLDSHRSLLSDLSMLPLLDAWFAARFLQKASTNYGVLHRALLLSTTVFAKTRAHDGHSMPSVLSSSLLTSIRPPVPLIRNEL